MAPLKFYHHVSALIKKTGYVYDVCGRHKLDYTAAEVMLRKLLKQVPNHSAGTLQLARLLADVHFGRATSTTNPESEPVMDEICMLYEKSIASNKEVAMSSEECICLRIALKFAFFWHGLSLRMCWRST